MILKNRAQKSLFYFFWFFPLTHFRAVLQSKTRCYFGVYYFVIVGVSVKHARILRDCKKSVKRLPAHNHVM